MEWIYNFNFNIRKRIKLQINDKNKIITSMTAYEKMKEIAKKKWK